MVIRKNTENIGFFLSCIVYNIILLLGAEAQVGDMANGHLYICLA